MSYSPVPRPTTSWDTEVTYPLWSVNTLPWEELYYPWLGTTADFNIWDSFGYFIATEKSEVITTESGIDLYTGGKPTTTWNNILRP